MKIDLPSLKRRLLPCLRFFLSLVFLCLPYFFISQVHWRIRQFSFFRDVTDAARFARPQLWIILLVLAGVFYSLTRLETLYGDTFYSAYHARDPRPLSLSAKLGFLFSSPRFFLDFLVFALLLILLPLSFTHPAAEELFGTAPGAKLRFLLLALPVLFLCGLGGRLSALAVWSAEKKRTETDSDWARKKRRRAYRREWASVFFLYLFTGFLLQLLFPQLVSIGSVLLRPEILKILAGIAAFFLLLALIRWIRAVCKRREALRRLRSVCAENGYLLSPVRRPYLSLFFPRAGEDFSVTARETRYSCKFIPALRRGLPLVLSEDGIARYVHDIRIRGVTLLSWSSTRRFGYASDDRRILLVNPVPAKLLGSFEGKTFPLDNGDRVGEYLVYTPGAFLHMLELDCVEKRENAGYGYKK